MINLRKKNIKSVYYGPKKISYLGPKIWNLVSDSIKYPGHVHNSKSKIKFWKPEICPYRL